LFSASGRISTLEVVDPERLIDFWLTVFELAVVLLQRRAVAEVFAGGASDHIEAFSGTVDRDRIGAVLLLMEFEMLEREPFVAGALGDQDFISGRIGWIKRFDAHADLVLRAQGDGAVPVAANNKDLVQALITVGLNDRIAFAAWDSAHAEFFAGSAGGGRDDFEASAGVTFFMVFSSWGELLLD